MLLHKNQIRYLNFKLCNTLLKYKAEKFKPWRVYEQEDKYIFKKCHHNEFRSKNRKVLNSSRVKLPNA